MEVGCQHFADALCVNVIDRWNQPDLIEQRKNVHPEVVPAVEVGCVKSGCFSQQDHAADCIQGVDVRHSHRDDSRAKLLGCSSSLVNSCANIGGNSCEVEI